jgi:LCP family protein required for cell wall assembly
MPHFVRSDDPHTSAKLSGMTDSASEEYGPARARLARRTISRAPVRWWQLTALIVGLVLVLAVGGVGIGGWLYSRSVEKQIDKVDAFQAVPEAARPAKVAEKALNFLIVGTDAEGPNETRSRTDSIILAHLPASRDKAQLISIPRDTWVSVPKSVDGRSSGTEAKINAAFAWGGTPLMVRTVESFTGVRIDHVVILDFAGFGQIIDALGGVEVLIDATFTSNVFPYRRFTPGLWRMDGVAALEYARERHQFADGDFARMRHQHAIISAVVSEATRKGLLASPARLNDFVHVTANAVKVDDKLSIFDTAWALRKLGAADLTMLTSPSAGTGMVGDQSVVFPDTKAAGQLFAAVRNDTTDQWLAKHPG